MCVLYVRVYVRACLCVRVCVNKGGCGPVCVCVCVSNGSYPQVTPLPQRESSDDAPLVSSVITGCEIVNNVNELKGSASRSGRHVCRHSIVIKKKVLHYYLLTTYLQYIEIN